MSSDGEQKQIKVFISSISANKEVKQQQHRVLQTLEVKRIPFETKDIAVDQEAKRDFRRLMRVHDARAPTPQVFNGETLCGNYEAFCWAVDEERLKVFLLLEAPAKKPPPPKQQQQQQPQQDHGGSDVDQPVTSEGASSTATDTAGSEEHTTSPAADDSLPSSSSVAPPPPPPPPPASAPAPAPAPPPPPPPPLLPPSSSGTAKPVKEKTGCSDDDVTDT